MMIIDCISDLHGFYPELEGGDLLIIAGDLTARDKREEWEMFLEWMDYLEYKKIVLIAGNHDNTLQKECIKFIDVSYLCDSGTEFEGLKIWGSPWTLSFEGMNPNCMAFTCETEDELESHFRNIPDDIDILVTHSPPLAMKDKTIFEENVGSKSLLRWVSNHANTLKLHVFGHIHESYGVYDLRRYQEQFADPITTVFVNASHVNEHYKPVNKPVRIIL